MILVALHCPSCQRPHVASCPADLREGGQLRDACVFCGGPDLILSHTIEPAEAAA